MERGERGLDRKGRKRRRQRGVRERNLEREKEIKRGG